MAHGLIDPTVGVCSVMAGVMNHRPLKVQRQKACAEQHLQRPSGDKPTPDGQGGKRIPPKKQPNGGIPKSWRIDEFARNRAVSRSNRTMLLLLSSALVHPEGRQQVWNVPEPP